MHINLFEFLIPMRDQLATFGQNFDIEEKNILGKNCLKAPLP